MNCAVCRNCRWVCENHPDRAWPDVCDCGAGAPCPVCNPCDRDHPPEMPERFRSVIDVDDCGTRPLPNPPRCRGIKVDETYTGCAYGCGDLLPFTGPCDCPGCNGSGLESGYEPNLEQGWPQPV